MKTNWIRPQTSRRAFTLVELIVVLMILVGLAAVLIPAITDMVGRTNRSTASSNISEVSGAIQRYEAQYMTYPDNFDSLMEDLTAGGTLSNSLHADLIASIEDRTLSAGILAALNAAGITSVSVHPDDSGTFGTLTAGTLLATSTLQALTTAKQVELGLETTGVTGKYIVLGVGPRCDMNGKTMLDAPVHFPREPGSNPETTYSRFIAVFQITDSTTPTPVALDRAKLVTVIAPDGTGLSAELDNYFEIASNQ